MASTDYSANVATRTFLTWAIQARVAPRLTLPPHRAARHSRSAEPNASFDALLRAHLAERAHQVAPAANPDSDYLFPGRLAGLAIQPNGVRQRLQNLGIPNAPGRCRALRELVLQAPPALIAPLLGFNTANAERIAAEAGNTWKQYAPGDHTPLTGTNR